MPAPDLTRIRARVEDVTMPDTCRITHDPESTDDDVLDAGTLALARPGGDEGLLYEGPCGLQARGPSGRTSQKPVAEGGRAEWAGLYTLKVPISVPMPPAGATVTMLASLDPGAVGLILRVRGATAGTFKLSRQIECEVRS